MGEQELIIEDWNPSDNLTNESHPLYCERCKRLLTKFTGDNFLGRDQVFCKHWCDKCFIKIKSFIKIKREVENAVIEDMKWKLEQKKKEEQFKRRAEKKTIERKRVGQTTLNFNEVQHESLLA
jgi:hypothetical protein